MWWKKLFLLFDNNQHRRLCCWVQHQGSYGLDSMERYVIRIINWLYLMRFFLIGYDYLHFTNCSNWITVCRQLHLSLSFSLVWAFHSTHHFNRLLFFDCGVYLLIVSIVCFFHKVFDGGSFFEWGICFDRADIGVWPITNFIGSRILCVQN